MRVEFFALVIVSACASAPRGVKLTEPVASAPAAVRASSALVARRDVAGAAFSLGARALVVSDKTWSIVSDPDAPPIASRALASPVMFGTQPGDSPFFGKIIVGHDRDGALVAIDAATLRDVWSTPRTGTREYALAVAHATGTIAALYTQQGKPDDNDLVAFDDATGAERWHRSGHTANLFAGGPNVYVGETYDTLVAIDAITGKDVFRAHVSAQHVVADETRVVATSGDDTIHVLDAQSGRELAAHKVGTITWGSEIAIDRGAAYVYASEIRDESAKISPGVVAIDLASGAIRWRFETKHTVAVDGGTSTGGLATTSASVVFCTSDGVVHALDRATGALQWTYGLGRCGPITITEDRGAVAAWVQGPDGTDVLTSGALRPMAATITGVVALGDAAVANARVVAYGMETTTDEKGRYTLHVEGQGRVIVRARGEVPPDDKCDATVSGATDAFELDGKKTTYELDVSVTQVCSCGM